MRTLKASVRTLDSARLEGDLVGGQFVVGDITIQAARMHSLDLPHHVGHDGAVPGTVVLEDGSSFPVFGTVHGWFKHRCRYAIDGCVILQVASLAKEVRLDAKNIAFCVIGLSDNPEIQSILRGKLLEALASWLQTQLIDSFSEEEVRFYSRWKLKAKLDFRDGERSSRKLQLNESAVTFAAGLASAFSLRVHHVNIDDYGEFEIELDRG